jgi:hypothetical protein
LILGLRRGRLGRAAALVADTSISANHGFGIDGIGNTGTLTVRRSVISGNGAREGGGINNSGDAAIVDSTIEGNFGFHSPGGILNFEPPQACPQRRACSGRPRGARRVAGTARTARAGSVA